MHALAELVRREMEADADAAAFAELVDRRLGALERVAAGDGGPEVRAALRGSSVARRCLARREAVWSDGDENLVRGVLDRWGPAVETSPPADVAQRLLAVADHVSTIGARPETAWFLLWEMEGMLADLVALLTGDRERRAPRSRT